MALTSNNGPWSSRCTTRSASGRSGTSLGTRAQWTSTHFVDGSTETGEPSGSRRSVYGLRRVRDQLPSLSDAPERLLHLRVHQQRGRTRRDGAERERRHLGVPYQVARGERPERRPEAEGHRQHRELGTRLALPGEVAGEGERRGEHHRPGPARADSSCPSVLVVPVAPFRVWPCEIGDHRSFRTWLSDGPTLMIQWWETRSRNGFFNRENWRPGILSPVLLVRPTPRGAAVERFCRCTRPTVPVRGGDSP